MINNGAAERRAILSALQFFGHVHPYRRMLYERIWQLDSTLKEKRLNRELTGLIMAGQVIAYEQYDKCLLRLATKENQ